ncbi:MAG: putative replication initiation protein [Circoviridae sp.]|nr:MAG: putative replication initiation protein [Circoviridae sp.]
MNLQSDFCRNRSNFKGLLCGCCGGCSRLMEACDSNACEVNFDEYRQMVCQIYYRRIEMERIYIEECKFLSTGKRYHNFITLNFPPDYNILTAIAILKQWSIDWLRKAKFVVEFHTKSGGHPHIHLISYVVRKKTILIRDLSNKFKAKPECFDVVQRPDLYTTHINYINGVKTDRKDWQITADESWRETLNIQSLYTLL